MFSLFESARGGPVMRHSESEKIRNVRIGGYESAGEEIRFGPGTGLARREMKMLRFFDDFEHFLHS